MFSAIRSAYTTPTCSTPASVNTPQIRQRTISEPPDTQIEKNTPSLRPGMRGFHYRDIPAGVRSLPFRGSKGNRFNRAGAPSNNSALRQVSETESTLFGAAARLNPGIPFNGIRSLDILDGGADSVDHRRGDDFVINAEVGSVSDTQTEFSASQYNISGSANGTAFDRASGSVETNNNIASHHFRHPYIDPAEAFLYQVFSPFFTPDNKKEFEALIIDRIIELTRMGIDCEELARRLDIAKQVDNMVAASRGAFSSLGFIVGTQAAERAATALQTVLSSTELLFVPGFTIGIIDRILSGLLTVTQVDYYTKGNPEKLESVMQHNLERLQRGLNEETQHQAGVLAASYSIRNVVRSAIAPLIAHFDQDGSKGLVSFIDNILDGLGGIPAGALAERLRNGHDRQDGLMHAAYLLGRIDWKEQLNTLKDDAWSLQRLGELGGRTWSGLAELPRILLGTCRQFLSVDTLTEVSLLPASLALLQCLKDYAEQAFPDAKAETSAFLVNAVGTFSLGIIYYVLGVCMTVSARRVEIPSIMRRHASAKPTEMTIESRQPSPGCEIRQRSVTPITRHPY
jgi:hypothetical protein